MDSIRKNDKVYVKNKTYLFIKKLLSKSINLLLDLTVSKPLVFKLLGKLKTFYLNEMTGENRILFNTEI